MDNRLLNMLDALSNASEALAADPKSLAKQYSVEILKSKILKEYGKDND